MLLHHRGFQVGSSGMVTVEDQENVKEEGNEEWGKNWDISKHTKENKGKCRREKGGECRRQRGFLLF